MSLFLNNTQFKPPGPAEADAAIGDVSGLPPGLRHAFDPGRDFTLMNPPEPGDWLAEYPEAGQTYDQYVRSGPNRPDPDPARRRVCIQPIGRFPPGRGPSLDNLRQYAEAAFSTEVDLLAPFAVTRTGAATRRNPYTGNRQVFTPDILAHLKARLPDDAFCMLAVTFEDLYPDPGWNFVFGQASLRDRVGVFSFARYDPAFYGHDPTGDIGEILLRRSCKVLLHETGHMFSMHHCVFFQCVMNGSNHLDESDQRPMHLCPVCLRKLHHAVGFDIADRYRELQAFYRKAGFSSEAEWVEKRLKRIGAMD